jgi:hypothetical protein
MIFAMDEKTLLAHINDLVNEEHQLRTAVQTGKISAAEEHARLSHVEQQLDQLWDLMRRRRAAKLAGTSPDEVDERTIKEVEGYLQ